MNVQRACRNSACGNQAVHDDVYRIFAATGNTVPTPVVWLIIAGAVAGLCGLPLALARARDQQARRAFRAVAVVNALLIVGQAWRYSRFSRIVTRHSYTCEACWWRWEWNEDEPYVGEMASIRKR